MKKLFIPFVLSALAGMILSSCSDSSKLSFTKRHYRSGYYVDVNRRNHSTAAPSVTNILTHRITPIARTKSENYVTENTRISSIRNIEIVQKSIAQKKEQKSYSANITSNSTKQLPDQTLTESLAFQSSQALSEVSGSSGDDSAAGAALSLLWIVIVVVLILWLLGLVVGIGPFVNLLLIIALILLILWLFRII